MQLTSGFTKHRASVLVVDDEPAMLDMFRDVIAPEIRADIHSAATLAEARKMMTEQPIDLMIADIHLPDGDGMTLMEQLRLTQPGAGAMFMTGQPRVDDTITALRYGAMDYLPKPFSAKQIATRVTDALQKQSLINRNERRLTRLKMAVRELNKSRKMVSQKVDILCNDLISAYGDLSQQLQEVRIQESFRKTLLQARDIEQLLCHAMDWILKEAGYTNIAIWLSGDEQTFDLGAYMKYTIVGDKKVASAMKGAFVQPTVRDTFMHLASDEFERLLQPQERRLMPGQTLMSVSCAYLGESLGLIMLFRDGKTPFKDQDELMLRNIAPIFAAQLATMVHRSEEGGDAHDGHEGHDEHDTSDDVPEDTPWPEDGTKPTDEKPKKDKSSDSDWWKRGEPPPF